MTYAIFGAGNVGQALAKAFARKGIEVTLASRRAAEKLAPIAKIIGPTVRTAALKEATQADVLILAIPFGTYKEVAQALESWQGKTVIDAMNAYGVPPEEYGDVVSSLAV